VTRNFNSGSGGQSIVFLSEANGSPTVHRVVPVTQTDVRLRMTRSGDTLTAAYSVDGGASWVSLGSTTRAITTPRLGIIVGANESGGTAPIATIQSASVTVGSQ
jgi:hypothetical protein